jgi:hypothetical protein
MLTQRKTVLAIGGTGAQGIPVVKGTPRSSSQSFVDPSNVLQNSRETGNTTSKS